MAEMITKWGTPPAVAGEPVAWRYRMKGDLQWQYTERKEQFAHADEIQPLHTTPQPTHAQAGAVPLTDEQSHALLERMADEGDKWGEGLSYEPTREQVAGWCVAFLMRELPAHGIKGGQHGTDTRTN